MEPEAPIDNVRFRMLEARMAGLQAHVRIELVRGRALHVHRPQAVPVVVGRVEIDDGNFASLLFNELHLTRRQTGEIANRRPARNAQSISIACI